jgi:hypothetical protein
VIKNEKMLNPNPSKCLNKPNIEIGDEDGGDEEAGNSGGGFCRKM